MKKRGREIIVIYYQLWSCKKEADEYIYKMIKDIKVPVRINGATDDEWEKLYAKFGQAIERGGA